MARLCFKLYLLARRATVDREFIPGKPYQPASITYHSTGGPK